MFKIDAIYDSLNNANIEGLKWAILSIKHVGRVEVSISKSTVYIYSEKKKIREELLINAGNINNCSFRVIAERTKI